VSRDQSRTDLSADEDRRYLGPVDGAGGSEPAIEGENETAYTGPAWPMRRRDEDGCGSLGLGGRAEIMALPSKLHTRM